ncbi:MAG: undecaprenyldiphospho-muramoylpentapeptide beta-N-acetylglucosaminyltransferase [Gemmatimonadetes bacterium]|nr:undecaprenyldiphospho-muramoylpentapeptide beta-N-acetylglucosaminyltransferase [Gemmatimonadota bacterium]
MRRVLFAGGGTGGHLYPALALADALCAAAPDVEVHFVGAKRGIEAHVLPARNAPHTLLPIEPLHRRQMTRNWRVPPALVRSLVAIASLFRAFRPQLVVGTGGYAAAPACLWAVVSRVPMAVQEQNSWPGATTRMLARWARQVHLGFPEAAAHLRPGRRTRVFTHGNPIRPPDQAPDAQASRARLGLSREATVLLVVGGSQGSRAINQMLTDALDGVAAGTLQRPGGLEILWATGAAHLDSVRTRLAPHSQDWVHTIGYIDDMPAALAAADFAISRAGAMATAELLAWGIPALLVPLPTAAADHQSHNARALDEAGAAVCLNEATLMPVALWSAVTALASEPARRRLMASRARQRARPDAARAIATELLTLLPA